ncbi:ATP phosphoribosyltransferase regulatory subunit [Bacillus pseudomycoides]|uniref:ATP phosphoribosyltransferase regulatory subunit n=1 Tax=Bacillus pseudomycoides TaxID=64104 RepID=A0AA91VDW0_9BACI|nr:MULTISPECIES: ATP phosphoribosyltransferase regulatory subunit [Bacillus]PEB52717.1 ATP phosphoribosyltransferase regulatory subunit [Bacillus sp. AFS098217]PED83179.1 ATP phosphoribosyltransferase regulatory subunit [Bacillus pseudomycoides]PEU14032.1 ATP phosphoribosyltransferase regulatory subunit [Bacillus sp. AFS019443]PEU17650.1 ATP phosphoribosyltransferase regulatory subunit [Bacillus sp. AFS014408]PFW62336.1 ATP phosphoribosyltransferase regulatory subunit [Bacillus sp. AFS075034]
MTKWKRANPNGTRDYVFEECTLIEEAEQKLRRTFLERGYEEIRTPTIEFYDVFSFQNRPIDEEKMYKFFDQQGRIIVLRPDMTIPLARVMGMHGGDSPVKVTYSGNVFRANESLSGKYNEIIQTGIEIIGIDNIRAEIECVVSVIQALQGVGVHSFTIELGQVQLYKCIVKKLSLKEEEEMLLRTYIESKNYAALSSFLQDKNLDRSDETVRLLERLPRLFGKLEVIEEAEKLASNDEMRQAIARVKEIYQTIEKLGYGSYISIDLGMIQHLHYYTGVIFKGYIYEVGEEIVSGGRYDELIGNFGESRPAVGLAIQVNQIVRALQEQQESFKRKHLDVMIHYTLERLAEAERLCNLLQKDGWKVELSLFDSLQDTFQFARKNGITTVIEVAGESLVEYVWKEKWMMQKEGETSCVTFKLR